MTLSEARRVFGDLMKKAREGSLTERDRTRLSQARQLLRRAKRPAMNARRKRNPIDRGDYFWIVRTTTFPTRYLTEDGLSPHHVYTQKFPSYEDARKAGQKFFRGTKTLWQIEQRDDEWLKPTSPGKPRRNPRRLRPRAKSNPQTVRIGRALEVRYQRDIGRHRGYYKHSIKSRRAGVYTIPPGWVYVSGKSILISEKDPRRK